MPNIPVPTIDPDESNYAHCRVVETLPIAADSFFEWFMAEKPENLMRGTVLVSPVIRTEKLTAEPFGAPGTSRMFYFKDGTIAREVILSSDFPREYSYQPYGYDNPIHILSDYAKATMRAEPEGDRTRVIWDYAFHAKNKYALQPVKLFVSFDWKRNLTNALKVMKAHLEVHGASKQIDDVSDLNQVA